MADKELTDLTALGAAPASGDLFLVRDTSDTTDGLTGTDKKVTLSDFQTGLSITESQISDLGSYVALTSLSVTDSGGDGSLTYNSSTGVFTYTGPSAAEVRTHLSVGAEASASGDGAVAYNSSTGVFTYTPPTLSGLSGSINDLSDVTLTSTASNDVLSWNGSAFVNVDSPTLDSVKFDTAAAESVAVGELAWNSDEECLEVGLNSDVTLQIGQEVLMRVKATEAVRNGMAVYASGQQGGSSNIEAKKFIADDLTGPDELYFIGIATEALSLNETGFVATFGRVRGVDGRTHASGGIRDDADTTSWTVGEILYASASIAGALTSVKPAAPDRRMAIAWVVAAPSETNITIFVRAEHGYHLDEIHDVDIDESNISDNEVLSYDSATGTWINQTLSELGATSGTVTSVAASVPTGFTVSGSPITSSGTLAIAFDTGYSLPTTTKQTNWDTAYGWGDHSTQGYLTGITGENLSSLADVTITSIASGELIKWNGSAWVNNTLAEAGIAASSHTHAASDVTSGTFADARIAESNVTQHQAALSVTESQISDFGTYITNPVTAHIDINGQVIGDGTRELLTFTEDASAVNHINIENEATGGGPIIRSAGDDANIPLVFKTTGSGAIYLDTLIYSETDKKLYYADIGGSGVGTALTISSAGVDASNVTGATGGALTLKSGDAADSAGGASGAVSITSGVGTSGASGALTIGTGGSNSANSGSITIQTGTPVTSGSAGDIILAPASDAVGGDYGDVRPDGDGVQNLGTLSNRWKAVYQTTNYFVETGAGTNFVAFAAPASIASDVTWTLPASDGDSGQVLTTDGAGNLYWDDDSQGGAGSSSATTEDITQSSHGFVVGDVLKFAGGSYAKAQANTSANAEVVGIVSAVSGANDFTITYSGRISGLSGLTANTTYFLDPSTAGAITATEPTTSGQVTKPVLVATSTTSGVFITYRGADVGSAADALDYQWIGAGAMIPFTTNGAAATTTQGSVNGVMVDTLDFDTTTEEGCGFWTNFGEKWNAGTIKVKFHWTAQSGSGTVKWNIASQAYSDDSEIDQGVGSDSQEDVASVTDTFLLANDMHTTVASETLIVSDAVAGKPVYFEITRDVAGDTLGVDAQLIGVTIEYTKTTAAGW